MLKGEKKIEELREKKRSQKKEFGSKVKELTSYYQKKGYKKSEVIKAVAIDLGVSEQTIRNYQK